MNHNGIMLGNRIPQNYFITQGSGQSDITIHAGSFHLALRAAKIEMCNIIKYSSILPARAKEIPPPEHIHGEVMETIIAVADSNKGQKATAGLIIGMLYDKTTGKKYGGLVCEQAGDYSKEDITIKLNDSLNEIYNNGYSDKYELKDLRIFTETIIPEKKYGTAIIALCFTNYFYPKIN